MDAEDRQSRKDMEVVSKYREETSSMRRENEKLRREAVVFQGSKCSACQHALELPSVHFLCLHSFHEHCFQSYSDSDSECPACRPHNKKIVDIIK